MFAVTNFCGTKFRFSMGRNEVIFAVEEILEICGTYFHGKHLSNKFFFGELRERRTNYTVYFNNQPFSIQNDIKNKNETTSPPQKQNIAILQNLNLTELIFAVKLYLHILRNLIWRKGPKNVKISSMKFFSVKICY